MWKHMKAFLLFFRRTFQNSKISQTSALLSAKFVQKMIKVQLVTTLRQRAKVLPIKHCLYRPGNHETARITCTPVPASRQVHTCGDWQLHLSENVCFCFDALYAYGTVLHLFVWQLQSSVVDYFVAEAMWSKTHQQQLLREERIFGVPDPHFPRWSKDLNSLL